MKTDSQQSPEGRFANFVRGIVNVPGAEVRREIEAEKTARAKKKKRVKKPASRASSGH